MRIHPLLVSCALALPALFELGCATCRQGVPAGQPHSCPNTNAPAGTLQGACRSGIGTTSCDDGLVCSDGTCIPCGGAGQACCQPLGVYQCNVGTCDASTNNALDWPTCLTCGSIGSACCDGGCPISGACDGSTQMCVGASTSPCSGPEQHFVWTVDPYGCAVTRLPISSTDAGQALTCAKDAVTLADPKAHPGPLDTEAECRDVCSASNLGVHQTFKLCAFSAAELTSCEQSQCGGGTCTWTDGACP